MQATIVFEKNWNAIHAKNPDGTQKYKYILNKGSSRSSKTFSLIDCVDLYAREQVNHRLTVWRDTKTDCKKTVLNDTLRRLKATNRYKVHQDFNKTESIFTYSTGSTFEIHGTDDEETVHGLTQNLAWLNEPYKMSRDTFDQIDQRADIILIDLNPKKGHWSDDLEKDPRCLVIHSTFRDNPFCPPEQRIKILSYQPVSMCAVVMEKLIDEQAAKDYDLVTNPLNFDAKQLKELSRCKENEYKRSANSFNWSVYGLGLKAEKPNRIYSWDEISIDAYHAISAPILYGSDWGAVDPWAIVEAKYYDGGLYVRELNYSSENTIRRHLTDTERAVIDGKDEGIVSWKFNKLSIPKTHTIVCDNNREAKIRALRASGWEYAIAAPKGKGSIIDGIDLVCGLKVYYTSCSENLKYEQENYSRKVDKYGVVLEEPEDMDNHCMDDVRYIATHLQDIGVIKTI